MLSLQKIHPRLLYSTVNPDRLTNRYSNNRLHDIPKQSNNRQATTSPLETCKLRTRILRSPQQHAQQEKKRNPNAENLTRNSSSASNPALPGFQPQTATETVAETLKRCGKQQSIATARRAMERNEPAEREGEPWDRHTGKQHQREQKELQWERQRQDEGERRAAASPYQRWPECVYDRGMGPSGFSVLGPTVRESGGREGSLVVPWDPARSRGIRIIFRFPSLIWF